jgi:hypothetical protein
MNKKLVAKTQYLNPTLPESATAFAMSLAIEPENEEIRLKRGTIYAIFSIRGASEYDTDLLGKVVHDILHNSYYQSDNISPIQSLEKSIADVKDKIAHFTNETIATDTPPEFSIVAGVLWGNVMYVVQYGEAQGYLVREGEIKPINTISEGGFSAASGVVRDGDVMILCSAEFGKKYPPSKLISMAIGEQQLMAEESCVLLKFIVDASFSPNEQIDFGLPEEAYKKDRKGLWDVVARIKPRRVAKTPKAPVVSKATQVSEPVSSIGTSMPVQTTSPSPTTPSKTQGIKLRKSNKLSKIVKNPGVVAALIAILLGSSIFWTLRNRSQTGPVVPKVQEQPQESIQPVVEGAEKVAEEPDQEVFYDIKIADPNASPNSLAVFNSVIVVSDATSGKIFVSDQNTAKFEPEPTGYAGVKNLININNKLGLVDNEGYKVYDLANQKTVETYAKPGLSVTSAYLDFVYAVEADKINRYSKSGSTLDGSLWAQSADFEQAKSMAVAYSIYLITVDNQLLKYTSGKKDDFSISAIGESAVMSNAVQVFADVELNNIYVADAGNGRVLAFDDKGNLVKEYKPQKEGAWKDIKSIGVTSDEKTMYVLSGSKVYKINL